MRVYIDRRDWWVGYYRGDTHHYVCLLPTVVIRWPRRPRGYDSSSYLQAILNKLQEKDV